MNPIHQALVDAARLDPPQQVLAPVSGAFAESLMRTARSHRLSGLLLHAWKRSGTFERIPEPVRSAAATELQQLMLRSALAELEWPRVLRALQSAGIEPVALKGIYIADRFFEHTVSRQLRDIDFLVTRSELKRAVRVLLGQGYRCLLTRDALRGYLRHHFHLQLHHPHGFVLELHWNLTRPGAVFTVSADDIRRDAVRYRNRSGLNMLVPSIEHSILMVALQNVQEGFANLARTVDLDRLIRAEPGLDWSRLIDAADCGGLRTPLALSLQLCRAAFQTPTPPGPVARLAVAPVPRFHLALFRPLRFLMNQRATTRTSASNLLRLWLIPTGAMRRRALLSMVSDRSLDPLDWLWKKQPERARLSTGLKLMVYQGYLYGRGLTGWLKRDADPSRFWNA